VKDTIYFFTHLEKGFGYTSWNFVVRPGRNSLNYLAGKRKNYQKPVSYFLIWTGLYILLHNSIINYFHYTLSDGLIVQHDVRTMANDLLQTHFTFFIIPVIVVSAYVVYLGLARPRYNFAEIFTLCLYGGVPIL
jgi:hypothetical protein